MFLGKSLKSRPSYVKFTKMEFEHRLNPNAVRSKGRTGIFSRDAGEKRVKAKTRFLIEQNPEPEDLRKVDQELQEQIADARDASTKVETESE